MLFAIAILVGIGLFYGILRTTYFSAEAMQQRKRIADAQRFTAQLECEQRVHQKFYGEYNTKAYADAMRECSR